MRSRDNATARTTLEQAAAEGRIDLEWFESGAGRRFTSSGFADVVADGEMGDAHVSVCGPLGLVSSARQAARSLGARHIETEAFDIRGGFGPDLSVAVEEIVDRFQPASAR